MAGIGVQEGGNEERGPAAGPGLGELWAPAAVLWPWSQPCLGRDKEGWGLWMQG